MANRVKEVSAFDGTSWGAAVPLGADDVNIDITSSTTQPDGSAVSGVANDTTTALDTAAVIVSEGDTSASAWTKFNRFRKRVANNFNNYLATSLISSTYKDSPVANEVYSATVLNNYMNNVIGISGTTTATVAGKQQTVLNAVNSLDNNFTSIKNDNFVYNAWFTVNSRGFTQYIGIKEASSGENTKDKRYIERNDYTFDQWSVTNNFTNVSKQSDTGAIALVSTSDSSQGMIQQKLDSLTSYIGQTFTLSVLTNNENNNFQYYSITFTLPEIPRADQWVGIINIENKPVAQLLLKASTGTAYVQLVVSANSTRYFKAVKLEYGKYSTLKLDAPPEYNTEYQRCISRTVDSADYYSWTPPQPLSEIVHPSSTIHTSFLYKVGKTYLDNATKMYYGNPSILGYNSNGLPTNVPCKNSRGPIVCGSFAQLMLAGIPYDQSRFNTGSIANNLLSGGTNTPYSGSSCLNLNSDIIRKYYQYPNDPQMYANELAKMLFDEGFLHPVNQLTDIRPGDLIFFSEYVHAGENDTRTLALKRWESINHVELFVGWGGSTDNFLNTFGYSLSTNPNTSNGTGNAIYYRTFNANDALTRVTSHLSYYARIESSGVEQLDVQNLLTDITSPLTWTAHSFKKLPLKIEGSIEDGRAYTFIFKGTHSASDARWRMSLGVRKSTGDAYSGSEARVLPVSPEVYKIAPDTYRCVFIANRDAKDITDNNPVNSIWISPGSNTSSWSATLYDAWFYNELLTV